VLKALFKRSNHIKPVQFMAVKPIELSLFRTRLYKINRIQQFETITATKSKTAKISFPKSNTNRLIYSMT